VAELLSPKDHPIGTRRLCLDTGYYETFNRPNVTLVDVKADPIERIVETGIKTRDHLYELDLIVFALGFHAFSGAIERANIRNEKGASPTDHWNRGPRTLLGLMTSGFPNLFIVTGPGSPSVLANMVLMNEHHIDWIAEAIAYLDQHGLAAIEPTEEAQDAWTQHVADAAKPLLRVKVKNYMVHVNADDGSHVFMPYVGGLADYVARSSAVAAKGYEGFALTPAQAEGSPIRQAVGATQETQS
jgi:cation diffusion facilitator CzcD-associated flavoprotein CzcO